MLLEAIYHHPKRNWAFGYDDETIILRLRAKKNDLNSVHVLTVDKYDWDRTRQLISMSKFATDGRFDYYECTVKPTHRRLKYGFLLEDDEERIWMNEDDFTTEEPQNADSLFQYPFLNPIDILKPPAWVKDAVFYQIFPERFANGDPSISPEGAEDWGGTPQRDNFFGGDLQGILDHLDHLNELGINAIYMTPVFKATTNHKYDTEDYMEVDPHFGDKKILKKLVEACHDRGIRVLLDAVFNHSGRTFKPFVDVLKKGEASPYKDWFHVHSFPLEVVDGTPTYDTFGLEPMMPKLNTEHPEVKEYLLNVAKHWIEEVGIDGWRLDVADEVDHAFWREFRTTVKQANPEAYILGEMWNESSEWLQGDQFDATMNYPFTYAVNDFFVKKVTDAQSFAFAIGRQLARYPQQASEVAFNLLDSHDTPRLLTLCGGDKRLMRLAALFQFTYMGAPCIFYGDEIGLDGDADPGCRQCMEWDTDKQDHELFNFYRELIALRKAHPVLRDQGSITFLEAQPEGASLAYERRSDEEVLLVLLNRSDEDHTFELSIPEQEWQLVFGESRWSVGAKGLHAELLPYGYAVLKATPVRSVNSAKEVDDKMQSKA
ncbi:MULTISPECIES: alpha-glycosidase [Paenibacillus]|uniref:Alpha-amylase n=1 Tax=Paenibacillus polymyxa (strain SC2) TaxID=886882 RepID=E3EDA6_PAEPS|nr:MULTISPECIES: alpha-glycosidase [Paenibacillus]ADO54463.1 cyclomaltodextrinase [Paenibacillus polymyxa SC2]AZH27764.1 alpha-glycosidase [Paenibacillus sp. M-152]WPQ57362.1 alpha-glycosidase [Paenibacillus polymyxa]CCC83384.1 alpha-amylase [Paenibacillus polymyxa M1]